METERSPLKSVECERETSNSTRQNCVLWNRELILGGFHFSKSPTSKTHLIGTRVGGTHSGLQAWQELSVGKETVLRKELGQRCVVCQGRKRRLVYKERVSWGKECGKWANGRRRIQGWRATLSGLKSGCSMYIVQPWISLFNSRSLRFLICKTGIILVPTSSGCY